MEAKFTISGIFKDSLKAAKSQMWVLAGLLVGFCIISFTLSAVLLPMQQSVTGQFVINLLNGLLSSLFMLGYLKNLFQTLDGIEPQFSAYGQQSRKILTLLGAYILCVFLVMVGLCLLVLPGIYLLLRLQFFSALIVEEDAGVCSSLKRSWQLTKGKVLPLFCLSLAMLGVNLVGIILFGVGLFFSAPIAYMMYCSAFRRLNDIKENI